MPSLLCQHCLFLAPTAHIVLNLLRAEPSRYQEYIRDKSVQPHIVACITTFFENDVVKRHAWAW